MALVNSALVNYERLPMLEVVFDRLVRMMSTSLRNFTSDNVEVSLDQISSVRFGDYLNSIPLPAMLSVFKAEEWDNYGLMVVDSALIYSIVDVLLGGRRGTAAMRIEGRPYTTIERNLVERMVHVVLSDLSAAFDPLSPVVFRFDRLETNPRFATIARPANAAVLAKLRIDMEDRGGRLELLIPYATLEPVRELLLQMFMGEKFGRDFDLGNPPCQRALDDGGADQRRARRDDRAALRRAELEGRHPHPAQRHTRRQHPAALRRRRDVRRTDGPQGRPHRGPDRARGIERSGHTAMNISFPLILDILIVILLSATIGFAIVLNRRLSRLRDNKSELDDLVKGFADAAGRAEVSVAGMKDTAAKSAEVLQKSIDRAQALRDELQFMIEAADSLASRLESSVGAHTVRAMTGASPAAIKANTRQQAPAADPGLRAPTPGVPQRPADPPPLRRAAAIPPPNPPDPPAEIPAPAPKPPSPPPQEARSRAERELLRALENLR